MTWNSTLGYKRTVVAATLAFISVILQSPRHEDKLEPVQWTETKVEAPFWTTRQNALFTKTLKEQFSELDIKKYRQNFERTAKRESGGYVGYVFNDSDVYKVLEAASYALGIDRQPWLEKKVDDWIDLIGRAQEPSGYMDCHFQLDEPQNEWKNLRDLHELYCAGHLFEAAAAHYRATGKSTFLNIAKKLADHIDGQFGPGKHMGYPGHPEAELALIKLWQVTGEQRYFNLAKFFLNSRGSKWFATEHNTPLDRYDGAYWSDNELIRDHESIVGHAVRAAYLFSGATDLARYSDDPGMEQMLDRVWKSTTQKRMFVTGGIGPSGSNEGFTVDYDLPTFTAYQESCASIANALWNYRMALLHGDAKYADVMETAIYNGTLAGINYEGDKYFYTNPLASHGDHHRQDWFDCACCPPNIARLIGQLGGLSYAQSKDSAYVLLYVGGTVRLKLNGGDVRLNIKTHYPYSGDVNIVVSPSQPREFALKLRVPGWADSAQVSVNGQRQNAEPNKGFLTVARKWTAGDKVDLSIPMPVRRVISNPMVKETFGKYALARGPMIYCMESADNRFDMDQVGIPANEVISTKAVPGLFGGTTVLEGNGFVASGQSWSGKLFANSPSTQPVKFRAIPYCFWDNRGAGQMRVWLSPNPAPAPLRGLEQFAKVTVSFKNNNSDPTGINDGFVPDGSNANSPRQMHFWSHKGGQEWVQYSFDKPVSTGSSRVYWFDDTGHGECRVPKSWKLEYEAESGWKPVELLGRERFGLTLDAWNEVHFRPVTAKAFRITVEQQEKWASGIHEWQIFSE